MQKRYSVIALLALALTGCTREAAVFEFLWKAATRSQEREFIPSTRSQSSKSSPNEDPRDRRNRSSLAAPNTKYVATIAGNANDVMTMFSLPPGCTVVEVVSAQGVNVSKQNDSTFTVASAAFSPVFPLRFEVEANTSLGPLSYHARGTDPNGQQVTYSGITTMVPSKLPCP